MTAFLCDSLTTFFKKQPNMKTKSTFLLSVMLLLGTAQFAIAQSANKKISLSALPSYLKELQQGPPSAELMYREPALYQHLMQRRAVLTGILQKEVALKHLPEEALQVLKTQPQLPVANSLQQTGKKSANNFNLTKDINTSMDAGPYNYDYSFTSSFAVLNKVVYYSANDGIHGNELWRSDGTAAGTYIVKDINPGTAAGNAYYITTYKGKVYFMAYTAATGYEVYQSDGTAAGTVLLKDIVAGIYGSYPERFTVANGSLYFETDGNNYNSQLWKTDGTDAGTVMVADIYNSSGANGIAQLTSANGLLFFTAYSYTNGRELWRSDGTAGGTYLIKDINPNNNNNYSDYDGPANLTSFNGLLYFSANGGSRTLWQSDGSYAGTYVVNYNNGITVNSSGYAQYQDEPFAIAQNSLFFAGYYFTTGIELYKYNPSGSSGITLVKDISTGNVGSSLTTEGIRSLNDNVYFVIPDFTGKNYSLWKSDGTPGNTNSIKNLPGLVSNYNFYSLDDKLYFSTSSSAEGNEPWVSNGTAAGTKLLDDITNGSNSSSPGTFTLCNKKVYFNAYSPSGGAELWNTDGTAAGTKQVKDANTTSTADGVYPYSYNSAYATAVDADKIVFNGYRRANGYELWKSDGTAAGTGLLKELADGEASANPQFYASKNGKVYFIVYDYSGGISSESVYVTDGTSAGTKKLAASTGYIYDISVANNGIIFYTEYDLGYTQLWRTDSSGANFRLTTNATSYMGTAGNLCYFTASNSYGYELWRSDGTVAGTYMVSDIFAGSGSGYPSNFTPLGNKMIFAATDASYNNYLWVSDGTTAGTSVLKNVYPNLYNSSAVLKGKLYFNASESVNGAEPYVTDGTAAGTSLLKDIYNGSISSYPANFTTAGNTVYFTATDDVDGTELWKTTGTSSSTKQVKDITNGSGSSYLSYLTEAGGKLYFVNNNQLWMSDGTAPQTKAVSDGGLTNIQYFGYLIGTGNKLFFAGYDYKYGYELYEGDATASKFVSNAVAKTVSASGLNAQLASNPFINDIKLIINSPEKQQLIVTVSNATGQQLISKTIDAGYGSNAVSFDGKQLAQGVYFINIISKKETVSVKAVK